MAATLDIRFDRDEALRGFRDLLAAIAEPEDAFDAIGAALLSSTHGRFEARKSPEGEPWAPLAAGTLRRRGTDAQILRDSGNLYRGLDYQADAGGVALGSNLVYAALHQLGGTADMPPGPAAVPARPFLGLSDDDRDAIGEIFTDFLNDAGVGG